VLQFVEIVSLLGRFAKIKKAIQLRTAFYGLKRNL